MVVTVCAFLLSQLTTVMNTGVFPPGLEDSVMSTGLLGAVFVTITSQLSPRLVAILHPVPFMNNYIEHFIFLVCLFMEFVGFGFCARLIAGVIAYFARLKVQQEEETHELEEVLNDDPTNPKQKDILQFEKEEFNYARHFKFYTFVGGTHLKSESSLLNLVGYSDRVVTGGVAYPSTEKLSQLCESQGLPLPPFLFNPNDPKYIPPHVYSCHLLARNQTYLKKKLGNSSHHEGVSIATMTEARLNDGSIYDNVQMMVELLIPSSVEKSL